MANVTKSNTKYKYTCRRCHAKVDNIDPKETVLEWPSLTHKGNIMHVCPSCDFQNYAKAYVPKVIEPKTVDHDTIEEVEPEPKKDGFFTRIIKAIKG